MNFKKIIGVASILAPSILFAQKEITLTTANKDMSVGNRSSFILTIPETESKVVASDWEKQMKKEKGKVEVNKLETKASTVKLSSVSAATFTVYSSAVDVGGGTQFTVWIMDGDSFVVARDSSDKVARINKYLHDFGVQEYKATAKNQLETEQKRSKDLDKIYDGFVKDQKKAEDAVAEAKKDIEGLQEKNKKEEGNIESAKANKTASNAAVGNQQNLDAQKKTAKQVEGYIKDQQKAEDNIKSNNKRIERLQDKIKEETANAEKAKNLQGPARSNADAQKSVVIVAGEKINNIK